MFLKWANKINCILSAKAYRECAPSVSTLATIIPVLEYFLRTKPQVNESTEISVLTRWYIDKLLKQPPKHRVNFKSSISVHVFLVVGSLFSLTFNKVKNKFYSAMTTHSEFRKLTRRNCYIKKNAEKTCKLVTKEKSKN